ncbi:hypothetical protein CDD80_3753 [Ophiocordyceps camponoti-rufipedis]|uniref:Uncharacterized protein n=1 Tax=Ophiocordyceps camponoti-rufipedis TaxID=2004952 RepID=A0A2C5XID7_9HYPO|nr:hypothetical protein CDD80_3753 [Ophiocordyceps camponoti-rufipedis]
MATRQKARRTASRVTPADDQPPVKRRKTEGEADASATVEGKEDTDKTKDDEPSSAPAKEVVKQTEAPVDEKKPEAVAATAGVGEEE